ncbi:MAG TPA: homocysteine S-methyltransferase family protein [Bacteroidales bacterium]|nr:homocysteine S-methyltransferase family protein [Bacteroidales bacterium]HRW33590.1 homocysteine S-methyltransferase family protein [Thermotogota bacterium]
MDRKEFLKRLVDGPLYLDGSYGAHFFKLGYTNLPGEMLNLKAPNVVYRLQKEYVEAGSDILLTNTFSANRLKLTSLKTEEYLEEINHQAVRIAKKASDNHALVFGDISSTGEFPSPIGTMTSHRIYDAFYEQAKILDQSGVDGFIIETMSDLKELKIAILAIRDVTTQKPLIAHMTFEKGDDQIHESPRSVTGTPIQIFANLMNDMDVDVVGINCSLGPKEIYDVFLTLSQYTDKPLCVEPNAGDPDLIEGRLTYQMSPEEFAVYTADMAFHGASIIGGCCGTGPEHIQALKAIVDKNPDFVYQDGKKRAQGLFRLEDHSVYLSSRTQFIQLAPFTPIGERINPASNTHFQDEIENHVFNRMIDISKEQEKEGAKVLDLNFGIERILSPDHFKEAVIALDKTSSLPISFDIQTTQYLQEALFEYPGRPLINSARVTEKSISTKAAILKRHGGMLILLAMGKKIPVSAQERFEIIMDGIRELERLGICKSRILADPLVLSFGADNDPSVTLKTIRLLHENQVMTTMGLSNLSFGMPQRKALNAAFLAQAIEKGLSSAIMNTSDKGLFQIMKGALNLRGDNYEETRNVDTQNPFVSALMNGEKEILNQLVDQELRKSSPMEISQIVLAQAMNEIGELYSEKKIYLPHLILSAETSKPVFERLNAMSEIEVHPKGKVVLATVEGDVHDIGKKIVGTVLSSGGFEVIDIGKDVPTEKIVEEVKNHQPEILGLSAMMTTTVGKVKEVSLKLKQEGIEVYVISGGASMNQRLATEFGCHGYSDDASGALKLCKKLLNIDSDNNPTP